MPTKVLDIDLASLPDEIGGLGIYTHALTLFRYRDQPIARINIPLSGTRLGKTDLLESLGPQLRSRMHQLMVWDWLEWSDRPKARQLPSATVAVCTRDRPDDLRACLGGIARLTTPCEVLVVDNCPSTDASEEVARQFQGVRYVREVRPGLDHARNSALANASGEVVAFIDDDATPDPLWLGALLESFDGPNVLCVTGLTMPVELETRAQEEFESLSTFSRGFHRRSFSIANHNPLHSGGVGAGVNMAVRRSARELVGGFDNALDAGTATQSGGDHEYMTRVLIAGFTIKYAPRALNWHRHRRTDAELEKAIYGYGVGAYSSLIRTLLHNRDIGAVRVAYQWFRYDQFPRLLRAWRKEPGAPRLALCLAELRGCLNAPVAYWRATRKLSRVRAARYA
jgi:glycosyltransferase involved in cell wall biosynthesis